MSWEFTIAKGVWKEKEITLNLQNQINFIEKPAHLNNCVNVRMGFSGVLCVNYTDHNK